MPTFHSALRVQSAYFVCDLVLMLRLLTKSLVVLDGFLDAFAVVRPSSR